MSTRYASSVPTREKTEDTNGVPRPPTTCGIAGCPCSPDVLTVIVLDNGRERAGAFCEFGHRSGDKLSLRKGYTFVAWVARCSYHHLRDLYGNGNGRWSDMAKTDRIAKENVDAYTPNPAWQAVGAAPERVATAVSPVHVSAALRVPQ